MGAHGYHQWNEGIRWCKSTTRAKPEKPDPDVVRLMDHYLLSYRHARLLKAFSFGLQIDVPTLEFIYGQPRERACWSNIMDPIRNRIPEFAVRNIGHANQRYIMDDARLMHEIRSVMNGMEVLQ